MISRCASAIFRGSFSGRHYWQVRARLPVLKKQLSFRIFRSLLSVVQCLATPSSPAPFVRRFSAVIAGEVLFLSSLFRSTFASKRSRISCQTVTLFFAFLGESAILFLFLPLSVYIGSLQSKTRSNSLKRRLLFYGQGHLLGKMLIRDPAVMFSYKIGFE
jgi:hypothetical protein